MRSLREEEGRLSLWAFQSAFSWFCSSFYTLWEPSRSIAQPYAGGLAFSCYWLTGSAWKFLIGSEQMFNNVLQGYLTLWNVVRYCAIIAQHCVILGSVLGNIVQQFVTWRNYVARFHQGTAIRIDKFIIKGWWPSSWMGKTERESWVLFLKLFFRHGQRESSGFFLCLFCSNYT